MDKKLFEQKLSEVADWEIPKLSQTEIKISKQKTRGKGRPSNEDLYQEAHEEIFLDLFNGVNPTHPPELLKVKFTGTNCPDCGVHCPNGRRLDIKFHPKEPQAVGCKKYLCKVCNLYKDPYTGKFTLSVNEQFHTFVKWARQQWRIKNKANSQDSDK